VSKPLASFPVRTAQPLVYGTRCRECTSTYQHMWYVANRSRLIAAAGVRRMVASARNQIGIWAYLGEHPCVDCGERDPVVLEFDHLRDKRYDISRMVHDGLAWSAIETEIAKCVVRCVNCHLRKTARENGTYDIKSSHRRIGEDASSYLIGA